MTASVRSFLHILVFILGLILIVGGIVTGKHGASIVGLLVAAVNMQQLMDFSRKHAQSNNQDS